MSDLSLGGSKTHQGNNTTHTDSSIGGVSSVSK